MKLTLAQATGSLRDIPIDTASLARVNTETFSGEYLLYRKAGNGMRRGGSGNPRFRHPTRESAEAEAARLLQYLPDSTFLILQEVGRVKRALHKEASA